MRREGMRSKITLSLLAAPTLIALACGGGDDTDAGLDATMDSTLSDTGHDAPIDSGKDATTDAADSGPGDASADVSIDATDASDAAVDAADASDAASEAAIDGGLDDAGCGAKTGFSFSSADGGCGVGIDYTCGVDAYQIECACKPFGICGCTKDDGGVGIPMNWAGCPSCTGTVNYSALATSCGIPY